MKHVRGLWQAKYLRITTTLAIWAALIWYGLGAFERFPPANGWRDAVTSQTAMAMAGLAALIVIATYLRAERWRALLPAEIAQKNPPLTAVYAWTFLVTTMLPFRTGELLRPIWVQRQGGSMADSIGATLSERSADVVVLFGMLLAAASDVALSSDSAPSDWAYALDIFRNPLFFLALLTTHAGVTWWARQFHAGQQKNPAPSGAIRTALHRLFGGLGVAASPARYFRLIFLTVAIWFCLGTGYILAIQVMFPSLPWSAGILVLGLTNLAGLLTISPGNLGSYEGAMFLALTSHGAPPAPVLIAALVLHAVVLATVTVIGVCGRTVMIRRGLRPLDLV